ncbi:MAG TPA: hypothetical protein VN577_00360 [Terriglobales bacterium]|nr:hypothetical protein [Terriglobales bacterium]
MLQQTRVGAVLDHYRRFLERFPTIEALARARLQTVLGAWSGLGYYRRARFLHECSKQVVRQHGGRFPETAEGLRQLPGIGRYTAAAIASIAFGKPEVVVDGNVERVIARWTGKELGPAATWDMAARLLSPQRPGDFNQAMMELGATVCIPATPKCEECPLVADCATRGRHQQKSRASRNVTSLALAFTQEEDKLRLMQRPLSATVMPGMWELPECSPNGHPPAAKFKHSIMNTDYQVTVFEMPFARKGQWVSKSRLSTMALTGLTRKILQRFQLL